MVWRVQKQQETDTLFWTAGVARMQICVLRSNLYIFGNISIISGVIPIDQYKVTCVYSKCSGHSYQPLYFALDYYTILKENHTSIL